MNFYNDLAKLRIIFFITVLSGSCIFTAFSQNPSPCVDLNHFNTGYSVGKIIPYDDVIIDNEGLVFLTSGKSIIISNGIRAQSVSLKENCKLTYANNTVYAFSESEAGYLYPDSTGIFKFFSLKPLFDTFSFPFYPIRDLQVYGNTPYISIGSALYLVKENEIIMADSSFIGGKLFPVGSDLLFYKPGHGIKKAGESYQQYEYKSTFPFVPDLILKHPQGFLAYSSEENLFIKMSEDLNHTEKWYSLPFTVITPFYRRGWITGLFIVLILSALFVLYKRFTYKYLRTPPSAASAQVSGMLTGEVPKTEVFTPEVAPAQSEKLKWEKFEMATVLFSDIEGFTKIAEQMNPEKLIDELDQFFFHFDSVCERYDIEKIKTIGDAYMAAGGIPKQNSTNPIEVVLAALEMQSYMKQLKNYKIDIWDLRIGIHSGPVIGGIIGLKKRSYDIWGDTVNTASRMESSGEPGKVNISSVTYSLIKDYFICEYRGKLPVKYKGNIDMFFVKGLRPELSVNLGTLPNRIFFLKMQELRLRDLEKFIFYKLESESPKNLYFNSINYIKHLYAHANLLSRAENLTAEDTLLVKTTILLLFTGLTYTYANYLNKSSEFAEKILPEYKYNNKQVYAVYNLILFAKLQHQPNTLREYIIHDLITEYYGRADFLQLYKLYFLEQNENIGNLTISKWKDQQIKTLKTHEFWTKSAKRLREVPAETQILNIELDNWQ